MRSVKSAVSKGLLALGLVVLSGCLSVGSGGPQGGRMTELTTRSMDLIGRATQREKFRLVGGDVIVRGPEGYCVDRSSRVENDFIVLGDCNVLRKADTGLAPYERGLLTVSVGPATANPPSLSDLSEAFEAYGEPKRRGRAVRVLVSEGGDRLVPGADDVYWRAVTVVNNRVVSLAAFGPPYSEMSLTRGPALLDNLVANIHVESPSVPFEDTQLAKAEVADSADTGRSPFDFLNRLRQ